MQQFVRTLRALGRIFWVISITAIICAAQGESSPRDVVQASKILEKIEHGEPVDYALMLFYGYGVKPDRPVIWSFVCMALFAALFWWLQGILPVRDGEPEEGGKPVQLAGSRCLQRYDLSLGGKAGLRSA